jgi:hypothetical protein
MPDHRTRTTVLTRVTGERRLSRAVARLAPDALLAMIARRGLRDSGDLLALATPEQLAAVFDLDLWKADRPGGDEQFDAARFCEWLEMFIEAGPAAAAARLAAIDTALVVAGLSANIRVFDRAAWPPARESADVHAEIGDYIVVARRPEAWEAVSGVLLALEEHHPVTFHRVMGQCRGLSNEGWELDGLDNLLSDTEQARFDLALLREERRERRGFVAPPQARAFLAGSRGPGLNAVTAPESEVEPRQLLQRRFAHDDQEMAHSREQIFLANVLVAGCSVQGRAFTPGEAIDAVAATCALGRAQWPQRRSGSTVPGPVTLFQAGWSLLYRDVTMVAARRLLAVVDDLRCSDRDLQRGLQALRRQLRKGLTAGAPWQASPRLDVLASFDLPAWAAITALLDECPVMLANVNIDGGRQPHSINPSEFQFVASAAHVAAVHLFLESLPDLLTR